MTSLIHVVGARPNFMKAAPVVAALRARSVDQQLIHTGQHYDATMSQIFFEELDLPEPDRYLGVGSGSHGVQTARLLEKLEREFIDDAPGGVVVYGDVNSTLAATIAAVKLGIPVAHVEAGLRSFDRDMPEEVNRVVTDSLAQLHLVTSPEAIEHLVNEGVDAGGIHFVGNPMIDTLEQVRPTLDPNTVRSEFGIPERYALVTLHRPANVDDPVRVGQIVQALSEVGKDLPIVFPIHPRGRESLTAAGLLDIPGLHDMDPLGYVSFTSLMAGATVVITDSGGIQEETTILGVPCLTLRPNTERPITITQGTNQLCEPEQLATVIRSLGDGALPFSGDNPQLWDGRAAVRIGDVIVDWLDSIGG